jgi:hypothetical protein
MNSRRLRDTQQIDRLAAAPSSWRILNLNRATRRSAEAGASEGFFRSRQLSSAIFVKHTLREHERDLFETSQGVATKVLVPLENQSFTSGALTFFVGERSYPAIMRQSLGIDVGRGRTITHPDARILARLDEIMSLDLFLVRELLGGDEWNIPKTYFEVSLLEDISIRAFVVRELKPLIQVAVEDASGGMVDKFVDAVFGPDIRPLAEDFFRSLKLKEEDWPAIVFAWKAALHYERQFSHMQQRMVELRDGLRSLKTYGHTEQFQRGMVGQYVNALWSFAARSYAQALASVQSFNSKRRTIIIESGRIDEFRIYLEGLPQTVRSFGEAAAMLEHILSFWSFRTRGLDFAKMPADVLCTTAAEICALEYQFQSALMLRGDTALRA